MKKIVIAIVVGMLLIIPSAYALTLLDSNVYMGVNGTHTLTSSEKMNKNVCTEVVANEKVGTPVVQTSIRRFVFLYWTNAETQTSTIYSTNTKYQLFWVQSSKAKLKITWKQTAANASINANLKVFEGAS